MRVTGKISGDTCPFCYSDVVQQQGEDEEYYYYWCLGKCGSEYARSVDTGDLKEE